MGCDGCTLCCEIFPVPELNKKVLEICHYCKAGVGCKIWAERPQVCRDFECAYLQDGGNIKLRPDKCGIIFEKLSPRIFYGTVVNSPTASAMGQVKSFIQQGYSVVLASPESQETRFLIAENHSDLEIEAEFVSILERNGYVRN